MPRRSTKLEWKEFVLVLLILSRHSIGRYRLAEMLGTTKARTRVILEFLSTKGLTISQKGRGGTHLTPDGEEVVSRLKTKCKIDFYSDLVSLPEGLLPSENIVIPCFLSTSTSETSGLYERDLVVRQGGSGAITLVYDKYWKFADSEQPHQVDINNKPELSKFNMLVLAFGSSYSSVLNGVGAIVEYYLESDFRDLLPGYQ